MDRGLWPQLYLKLVAGEYVPVQNAVHLKEFGEQLVGGGVRSGVPFLIGVLEESTFWLFIIYFYLFSKI